jgi:hypothetical protein
MSRAAAAASSGFTCAFLVEELSIIGTVGNAASVVKSL